MVIPVLLLVYCLCASVVNGCYFHHDDIYGGTYVDCSNINLSHIPSDLPTSTTSLDLSKNNITVVNIPANSSLDNLKYLDLSSNELSKLDSRTFTRTRNLRELLLHNNRLMLTSTTYPDNVFLPLQQLQKLHLHNNDPRLDGVYPENALGKLRSVKELKIDTFQQPIFGSGFSNMTNLKTLIFGFTGCKIQALKNDTLWSFRHCNIEDLDFVNCPFTDLEKMAFIHLKKLNNLILSNAKQVTAIEAVTSMYSLSGLNMTAVYFDRIYPFSSLHYGTLDRRILTNAILENLQDVCVVRFSMKSNKILWIGTSILKPDSRFSNCLESIDLSDNHLLGDRMLLFSIYFAPRISFVNVSNHFRKNELLPKMPNYEVSSSVPTLRFSFPPTLRSLYIHGTLSDIGELNSKIVFSNAVSLRSFIFAFNGLEAFQYGVYGLENLTELDISGNPFTKMKPDTMSYFPNLKILKMSQIGLDKSFLLNHGSEVFRPLIRLETIVLSYNDLAIMDQNIFSNNPMIKIDLSFNRFEAIPFDLTTTSSLYDLDLSFNSLPVLSETEMTLVDELSSRRNFTLNLNGNLLSCGCNNLGFVLWLFSTDATVKNVDNYICVLDNGQIESPLYVYSHYEAIWRRCSGPFWLSVCISGFALLFFFFMIMYVIIQKKTLLFNILMRLFGFINVAKPLRRTNFPNDAYIGYSDCDYQYICHTMREHLEDRHGVKLFLKDRDTIPGGQIADDIINGIDSSWKTVLILTQSFVEDQWCRFIVNRSVYSSNRMPVGSILLVLFEDVGRGDISPALLNVVEERHIFCVGRYRDDEERLWKEISQCIKMDED
ncbi:toll-like receptor 4 [Haliotis cracherodii]|uniref:toll-like receptor 4 n=1 Tax=Haliotis cracherodii TaxID=6455 RepID=UPI0039EC0FC7